MVTPGPLKSIIVAPYPATPLAVLMPTPTPGSPDCRLTCPVLPLREVTPPPPAATPPANPICRACINAPREGAAVKVKTLPLIIEYDFAP